MYEVQKNSVYGSSNKVREFEGELIVGNRLRI